MVKKMAVVTYEGVADSTIRLERKPNTYHTRRNHDEVSTII